MRANTVALSGQSAPYVGWDAPTTMTVNWTPFLTLFPLRLPAKDMAGTTGLLYDFGGWLR